MRDLIPVLMAFIVCLLAIITSAGICNYFHINSPLAVLIWVFICLFYTGLIFLSVWIYTKCSK